MIPKPLQDTLIFLNQHPVKILILGTNARHNSDQSEKNIITHLMNSNLRDHYQINSPYLLCLSCCFY